MQRLWKKHLGTTIAYTFIICVQQFSCAIFIVFTFIYTSKESGLDNLG